MFSFIFDLIINPLIFIYDLVFGIAFKICTIFNETTRPDYAIPIIAVSIVVNILTLPLYARADKIQEEERERQKELMPMVRHINKSFKGDERFMMLSTYYKQMNYKPIYAIRASVSLLLQIPFFTAAYKFFTNCVFFNNEGAFLILSNPVRFLFENLGKPDAFFVLGTFTINILPIIMTIINFVSSYIYTKGLPLRDKIQPYVLAILFLIILYNSPSGLVIYWTCNNIIALIKIVVFKKRKVKQAETKAEDKIINQNLQDDFNVIKHFKLSSIDIFAILNFISISFLLGVLIPIQVAYSNSSSFSSWYGSPLPYVLYVATTFIGLSLWILLFYYMSNNKIRSKISKIAFSINLILIINYFCFYQSFGYLNKMLKYDNEIVSFSIIKIVFNVVIICILILIVTILFYKQKNIDLTKMYFVPIISSVCMLILVITEFTSIRSFMSYKGESKKYVKETRLLGINSKTYDLIPTSTPSIFTYSKSGKNIVLILMDKMVGKYVEYAFSENPHLLNKYNGFVFYPDTLSFGVNTMYGSPGIFGGYNFTPIEHDKNVDNMVYDGDKLLYNSHNTALKTMPQILSANGYDIVVSNIPLENYGQNMASIFAADFEKDVIATKSNLIGHVNSKYIIENADNTVKTIKRNMAYYTVMKVSPLFLQNVIYDDGRYLTTRSIRNNIYNLDFLHNYAVLEHLSDYTATTDSKKNNFIVIDNNTVHDAEMLSYPTYEPLAYSKDLNKTDYYLGQEKFDGNLKSLYATIASIRMLGEYFDYLRQNNVYDNTKIIIVSDHGYADEKWGKYNINDDTKEMTYNKLSFNATLLVKDFGSKGDLKISDKLMTNADVPSIIFDKVVNNPINPFNGESIDSSYKNNDKLFLSLDNHYESSLRVNDIRYQNIDEPYVKIDISSKSTINKSIFDNDWEVVYDIK